MRWVIRAIGLVVVLAMAAVAALFLIPSDRIAALAAAQFQAATGRAMVITGGVKATIWPVLGVKIGHVEIANASWSKAGPMLVAEGVEVGVSPSVLLGGAVKVSKVVLTHPVIVLEKAKDGKVNWDFGGATPAAPAAAPATTAPAAPSAAGFSLADAEVTDGAVTWIDGQAGTKQAGQSGENLW
jgi:AsmA protein